MFFNKLSKKVIDSNKGEPGLLTFISNILNDIKSIKDKLEEFINKKFNLSENVEKVKAKGKFGYNVLKELVKIGKDNVENNIENSKRVKSFKDKFKTLRSWYRKKAGYVDDNENINSPPQESNLFYKIGRTTGALVGKTLKNPLVSKIKDRVNETIGLSVGAISSAKNRLQDTMEKNRQRMLNRQEEIDEEKRLAKKSEIKKKDNWLTKVLGAIGGVGKFIIGGFGKLMLGKFLPLLSKIIAAASSFSIGDYLSDKLGKKIPKKIKKPSKLKIMSKVASKAAKYSRIGLQVGLRAGMQAGAFLVNNPVGWAILATAAVGGIGYFGYKYWRRNKATDLDKVRLLQYGVNDNEEDIRNIIYKIESILEPTISNMGDGRITIRPTQEAMEEIGNIFDLDLSKPEKIDKEKFTILSTWLRRRFIPVLANNYLAIKSVNKEYTVEKIGDLNDYEAYKYLTNLKTPPMIFEVLKSPIKGNNIENITKSNVEIYIEHLLTKLKEKIKINTTENKNTDLNTKQAINKKNNQVVQQNINKEKNLQEKFQQYASKEDKVNQSKSAASSLFKTLNPDDEKPSELKAPTKSSTVSSSNPSINTATGQLFEPTGNLTGVTLGKGVNIENLNKEVKRLFLGMAAEYNSLTGKNIPVTSGFRTYKDQVRIIRKKPGLAAKPGTSIHELGLAIDIDSAAANELDKLGLMKKYGFTRPLSGEKWHIEPAGVAANVYEAKNNLALATHLTAQSPFRGGGGFAVESKSDKVSRNLELQKKIFNNDVASTFINTENKDKPQDVQKLFAIADNKNSQSVVSTLENNKNANKIFKETNEVKVTPKEKDNMQIMATASDDTESKVTSYSTENKVSNVNDAIKAASATTGLTTNYLTKVAYIESSLNPNAKAPTSNAVGLYQFLPKTWNEMIDKYGNKYNIPANADRTNPYYSALLGALYLKDNIVQLKNSVPGVNLEDEVIGYLGHHYGLGGAKKILLAYKTNPSIPMTSVVSREVYNANSREIGNKTVAEYIAYLSNKLGVRFSNINIAKQNQTYSNPYSTESVQQINNMPKEEFKPHSKPNTMPNTVIRKFENANTTPVANTTATIDQNTIETVMREQNSILTNILNVIKNIDTKFDPQALSKLLNNNQNTIKPPTMNYALSKNSVNMGREVSTT